MTLVNGIRCAEVSALDRGIAYGDGVFETLAVSKGRPCELHRHLQRLEAGLERLGIGHVDVSAVGREARALCEGIESAVLKIIVSRGPGGRGYRPPQTGQPTRILSLHPWPQYPAEYARHGVDVRLCRARLGLNPQLAGVKHLNRLEQVLARSEWGDEFQEGLMLDAEEWVIEGTMSNLFIVRGESLATPSLDRAGVAGIMRQRILEQSEVLGIPCAVEPIDLTAVYAADGLFLSNSIIGIWPIRRLERKEFKLPDMLTRLALALGLEVPR